MTVDASAISVGTKDPRGEGSFIDHNFVSRWEGTTVLSGFPSARKKVAFSSKTVGGVGVGRWSGVYV